MDDGQKSESIPEAPAPVFLGQTFGEVQKPVFQSTLQPHPEGANSPIYVKNEPQWGEATSPPPSFRWGQFFIGLFAPIAVSLLFVFVGDLVSSGQYDDLYGYEVASVSPDENGHYSAQISVRPGHEVNYCSIYADEWHLQQDVFCQRNWDDTLEVRQYLEPITQIQPLAFVMDEENGTFSVSYNGTSNNADDVSARLITSNGNLYHRIYSADHETDNTSSTSYLNSTFTPTNQTLYVSYDAAFFSYNEILQVHSCGEAVYHYCNASETETGYGMSVSWFGEQEHVQIGELTSSNETLWFIPTGEELTSYSVEIETYDHELDESISNQDEIVEGVFCLMPLVYIGAIIVSFVKGKNALGWGLLSSSIFSILLFVGFIILLIMSYGGAF